MLTLLILLQLLTHQTNFRLLPLYLGSEARHPGVGVVFFKALLLLTLIKMILLWPASATVMKYHDITLPGSIVGKILLAPAFLASVDINLFYGLGIIFLAAALVIVPGYLITGMFFWLTFNLYVINLPFANGADLVLFMLAFWAVAMPAKPSACGESLSGVLRQSAHNLAVVLCRVQVVIIYLVSGLDKLASETWRSGVAFDYIVHMDTLYHPSFSGVFDSSAFHVALSWTTIAFELLFVVLIWIERSRLMILAAGVCFHLFIGIVLSLPDFASVMIVSYIIFLKDDDIGRIKKAFAYFRP